MEINDDVLHRSKLTVISFEDIRNRYSNIQIQIGKTEKGEPVKTPLGKYWLNHTMRRQYDTIKFLPEGDEKGVYNLWRGFNVEPKPGECGLYMTHILQNICRGNEMHYDYVIKWMARAIQHPGSAGEVAIVLRGGKGAGKGQFARTFGRLFGRHHIHIANAKHLVGNFNAHLRDAISLFADEAFFAGDKQHESVLKMLITEDSIPIEMKGYDVDHYPNYVHLIMASNDPHVIRATGDERRYLVLDVGDAMQQNSQFFAAMNKELETGGYEALLYHLQQVDLTDFEVRNVPQTEALAEQKLMSMSPDEEWWYRKLSDGRLLESDSDWTESIPTKTLEDDYTNYADRWKQNRRGNSTILGRFLHKVCPHMSKIQRRVTAETYDEQGHPKRTKVRANFYELGSLEQCRAAWDKIYKTGNWPTATELDLGDIEEPF